MVPGASCGAQGQAKKNKEIPRGPWGVFVVAGLRDYTTPWRLHCQAGTIGLFVGLGNSVRKLHCVGPACPISYSECAPA